MRSAFIGASLTFVAACGQPDAAPTSDAGVPSAPSSAAPTPSTSAAEGELQPVYPLDDRPPDPLAIKYCNAVYDHESERMKACCQKGLNLTAIEAQCVRTLTWALGSGAAKLNEADVERCDEAQAKAFEGCDWVSAPRAPVEACLNIITGTIAEGQLCRSSLECSGDLHCFGLGAVRPGKCGKPQPNRKSCGPTVDTLATLTHQGRWEETHKTCAGVCGERLCVDQVPLGGECKASSVCGPGNYCKAGKCSEGRGAPAGDACKTEPCAPGLRCVQGTCVMPKPAGESCSGDDECAGKCNTSGGGKDGTCEMACPKVGPITPPIDSGAAPRSSAKPRPSAKPPTKRK